uniref:RING-type domain-containing protein n=1 Tax=Neogobius melanostomus TaxID=47308 RepID=A0A8C6TZI0_9GOBI
MNHQSQGEVFVHPLSNPGVAEEANRAGDYNLAAEIYSCQLQDLPQPDRGLCLRKADSLARAGRISEALESYCTAAGICKLQPRELPLLVETIAKSLREKELGLPWTIQSQSSGGSSSQCFLRSSMVLLPFYFFLDLFSCRLCRCLLHEPATLECGHTFCKRCLDEGASVECAQCKHKLPNNTSLRRINVLLSSLVDKLFATESAVRRLWIEGEQQWRERNLKAALDKYNEAVELGKSSSVLHGF